MRSIGPRMALMVRGSVIVVSTRMWPLHLGQHNTSISNVSLNFFSPWPGSTTTTYFFFLQVQEVEPLVFFVGLVRDLGCLLVTALNAALARRVLVGDDHHIARFDRFGHRAPVLATE